MPIAELASSPLAPGVSPVAIHYRDVGAGPPLLILHGGWGYEIYPFESQIRALAGVCRLIIPDRTGYGRSGHLARQESDFHHRAAAETRALIDHLALQHPVVWGHSDGAVIALLMGLAAPERLGALIVEAPHFFRSKPGSRAFFETMMQNPDGLGDRVTRVLSRDHGERWRELIRTNGDAWLKIAAARTRPDDDLYGGELPRLRLPTLVIHGAKDPRTEPGELDALLAALNRSARDAGNTVRAAIVAEGGHSPHTGRLTADEVTFAAARFLADIDPRFASLANLAPGLRAERR